MTLASGALFLAAGGAAGWGGSPSSCRGPWSPGFLFGAAIDVVIGELPKLTGTEPSGSNSLRELGSWFRTLGDTQSATVLVGVAALAVVFGLRIVAPAIPGALVLVVGGLLASWLFDLGRSRRGARGRRAARAADARGPRHRLRSPIMPGRSPSPRSRSS